MAFVCDGFPRGDSVVLLFDVTWEYHEGRGSYLSNLLQCQAGVVLRPGRRLCCAPRPR